MCLCFSCYLLFCFVVVLFCSVSNIKLCITEYRVVVQSIVNTKRIAVGKSISSVSNGIIIADTNCKCSYTTHHTVNAMKTIHYANNNGERSKSYIRVCVCV